MTLAPTPLFMHELLSALSPRARVLDLGCGNGSFPYSDYPTLQITALDLQEPAAASGWPANAAFHRGAAEVLPFPDESFDLVIGNFVFEHSTDFARAIAEAGRVLSFGSWLYLSVPNARSFEDELYRALFVGGGHLQRFGLASLLRTVYSQTSLKLMGFADWPAGFTFFEEREGLRQFIYAVVDGLRRSGHPDPVLQSNFIMAFRKDRGIGYRLVSRVCSYCGAGDVEPTPGSDPGERWVCRACGRTVEPRVVRLNDLARLETEMQSLPRAHRPPWLLMRRRLQGTWLVRAMRRFLGR